MAVDIPGLLSVIVFYLAILALGIYMGRKTSRSSNNESVLVADRSFGFLVSTFTLTATNVGGGYVLGSAESAAFYGVLQTVAPFGFCVAFNIAGIFYAPKIRREGYVTMFDPFQLKYGKKIGAVLFIPQFFGDLFWSAAVLSSLGATLSVILDINATLSIIASAAVAIIYTLFGGLYSVAYTDVIQLIFIAVGLVIAFPFALTASEVDLSIIENNWLGEVPTKTIGSYIDVILLCILGALPWQAFYQRILACKTVNIARMSSVVSGIFCLFLAFPPMLLGMAGSAAEWNATSYDGPYPFPEEMHAQILPLALTYLTPKPVAIVGLGAVAAAAMSSSDSCILSTSSVLTKNIYQDIIRPQASERELMWFLRVTILVVGVLGTLLAIFATTVYGLLVLCVDLMYVVLFPQLTLILWMPQANAYGSLVGFFASLILRIFCGEPVLNIPALIKFPLYDDQMDVQLFPFRTFSMLVGMICIVVVSLLTNVLFMKEILPLKYDILKCHKQKTIKRRQRKEDEFTHVDASQMVALKSEKI